MSVKNKSQSRRTKTRRRAARNRTLLTAVVGLIIAGTLFLMLAGTITNTSSTSPINQSRLELDPVLGNPDAPVTIIEYGAYACTACRAWHQAGIIEQILAAYPDQVRFVFRDFPVIFPAYDRMAAEVAQCALDQSQDGFWALHDALYTSVRIGSSQEEILRTAEQLGLDGAALRACVESNTHRATVQYDEDRARRLALPGTPSFLVNDTRIFNATPEVLVAAVEQALAVSS
jgi:protein-disulfide isomerase